MLEKYFKNSSEVFAKPFIKILKYLNLKPNTVSIFGLAVIIVGSFFFYLENRNLGILLIFLGSAIDGLDGPYARSMDLVSERGGILDSLIDRIGELVIWSVVGISFTDSDIELFTIFTILVSSNLIPYMRAKSEYFGLQNKKGLAARPERVIFAVIYMLFSLPFTAVYIFTLILWTTVYQRFITLYKNL